MDELTKIINLFEENFEIEQEYTRPEIVAFFKRNGIGKNSRNPSSFSYNRVNDGTMYFLPLFDLLAQGIYVYRGPNFKFNGDLHHKANGQKELIHVGTWNNGILNLHGPIPKELSREKIEQSLVQIIIYDARRKLIPLKEHFDFLIDKMNLN